MSFRARLSLVAAGAVAVAVVVASAITYGIVRNELRGQFDTDLRSFADQLQLRLSPAFGGGCSLEQPI